MKSVNKFIVVSLALVLTYVSIFVGSYGNDLNFSTKDLSDRNSSEFYFESKINLCFTQRSQENLSNLLDNNYSFAFKKNPNSASERNKGIENTLSYSTYRYILYSSIIEISSAIKNLIYPFDYFW